MRVLRLIVVEMFLCGLSCFGQGISLGTFNSPKGLGLATDFPTHGGDFYSTNVWIDYQDFMGKKGEIPGFKTNLLYNFKLHTVQTPHGNEFSIFAGPGISMGYVHDKGIGRGFMAALSADAGVKVAFSNSMDVSLSFTGELGMHSDKSRGGTVLSLYKTGLTRIMYPELRLMYNFDKKVPQAEPWSRTKRPIISLEWGFVNSFQSKYHYNFVTNTGRVDVSGVDNKTHTNWYTSLGIGYDIFSFLNVSVRGGIIGNNSSQGCFPVSFRATYMYKEKFGRRLLSYAEGGALLYHKFDTGDFWKLGGGYRFPIFDRINSDILIGLTLMQSHPDYYDPNMEQYVAKENLHANDLRTIAFTIGTALNF